MMVTAHSRFVLYISKLQYDLTSPIIWSQNHDEHPTKRTVARYDQ